LDFAAGALCTQHDASSGNLALEGVAVTHLVVVACHFYRETARYEGDVSESRDIGEAQILVVDSAVIVNIFVVDKYLRRSQAFLVNALVNSLFSEQNPSVVQNGFGGVVPDPDVGDSVSLEQNALLLHVTLLDRFREGLFQHGFEVLALVGCLGDHSVILRIHGADHLLLLPEHLDVLHDQAVLLGVCDAGLSDKLVHLSHLLGVVRLRPELFRE